MKEFWQSLRFQIWSLRFPKSRLTQSDESCSNDIIRGRNSLKQIANTKSSWNSAPLNHLVRYNVKFMYQGFCRAIYYYLAFKIVFIKKSQELFWIYSKSWFKISNNSKILKSLNKMYYFFNSTKGYKQLSNFQVTVVCHSDSHYLCYWCRTCKPFQADFSSN